MNIVFFGTPEFSLPFLKALHADEDILVSAVVCQPDKPAGRGNKLTPPPTKVYAEEHGIEVIQGLKSIPPLFRGGLGGVTRPDAFVVVAYGKIIPEAILNIPRLGTVNVHPSLLPKYRGPSPMQAAIADGETETGVSIMLLDAEMDHGPILDQVKITLAPDESLESLQNKVHNVGAPLLVNTLKRLDANKIKAKDQDHDRATFCKLLTREDGKIDWTQPAEVIDRQIRAFQPWPGTWTMLDNKRLKITKAVLPLFKGELEGVSALAPGQISIMNNRLFIGTGSSTLEITELQPEGKQKMPAHDFLSGHPNIGNKSLS
ncbi:MAG: methionyl-tRNA formyltransferase [bacterium]